MYLVVLAFVASCSAIPLDPIFPDAGETCGYDSCPQAEPGVLNVHIVPHTHDDVGWLKTVDQYYYGSRNYIQKAGVQYIIDSVVEQLWEDPKRRFMYVETAFFWKWWVRQPDHIQHKVHTLVRQGRLQFVSGAWSMNDEACTHYQSTIDQFTWGLRKLNDTFGACGRPRVGWQIDPFGHAREFASLLSAMGYDGLFLGRIDFADKWNRLSAKNMEMVWRGDDDLGKKSDLFTGVLYNTYSPPPGFCFDVLCSDEPIIDDVDSPMYNVESRVNDFLRYVEKARVYRTSNILVTMGGDFTYQDAVMWYLNLDKLIEYTNLKSAKEGLNVKLFYSTPDCYLKAVREADPTLPTKQDDFFPYASDHHAYWTGYFTSRPTTKFLEREGNSYLQMVKQLQVTAGLEEHNMFVLNELKSAMGVMQHHDAVTGTEKQHVAHDYERIMDNAIEDSLIIAREGFNKIMQGDGEKPALFTYERCRFNESQCAVSEESSQFVVTLYNHLAWKLAATPVRVPVEYGFYTVVAPNGESIDYQLVELPRTLNEIPTRKSKATHELVFIAHNVKPLGIKNFYVTKTVHTKRDTVNNQPCFDNKLNDYWDHVKREPIVYIKRLEDQRQKTFGVERIPDKPEKINAPVKETYSDLSLDVMKDNNGQYSYVEELERLIKEVREEEPRRNQAQRRNTLRMNNEEMRMLSDDPMVVESSTQDIVLGNEHFQLTIDGNSGEISRLTLPDGSTADFKLQAMFYPGCKGANQNENDRASGAYIFRPNATKPTLLDYKLSKAIKGNIVDELHYTSGDYVSGTVRIYKHVNLSFIEHEWMVGPIPIDNGVGKEVIFRYVSDIINNGEFFTDSNGRQMLKRKLNKRPQYNLTLDEPISANYYPVVNKIYLEDDRKRLTVLTDRAEGGSALNEGEIELMVHRRLLFDDAFGVGEALNETIGNKGLIARGKHRILMIDLNSREQKITERKHGLEFHLQPKMFVSDAKHVELSQWLKLHNCLGAVSKSLPDGLHLLTLEPWRGSKLLLRLENYLEMSDGGETDINVDLTTLFSQIELRSLREAKLAADRWADDDEKWEWNRENDFDQSFNNAYGSFGEVRKATNAENVCYDNGFTINVKAKEIRTFVMEYSFKS